MVAAVEAAAVAAVAAAVAVAGVGAEVEVAEAAVASCNRFRGVSRRDHEGDHSAVFHQERLS